MFGDKNGNFKYTVFSLAKLLQISLFQEAMETDVEPPKVCLCLTSSLTAGVHYMRFIGGIILKNNRKNIYTCNRNERSGISLSSVCVFSPFPDFWNILHLSDMNWRRNFVLKLFFYLLSNG